jgi:hypothetical protein
MPAEPEQQPDAVDGAAQRIQDMANDTRPSISDFLEMVKRATDMHRKSPNIFNRLGVPSAKNPHLFNGD